MSLDTHVSHLYLYFIYINYITGYTRDAQLHHLPMDGRDHLPYSHLLINSKNYRQLYKRGGQLFSFASWTYDKQFVVAVQLETSFELFNHDRTLLRCTRALSPSRNTY